MEEDRTPIVLASEDDHASFVAWLEGAANCKISALTLGVSPTMPAIFRLLASKSRAREGFKLTVCGFRDGSSVSSRPMSSWAIPEELAGVAALHELTISHVAITDGWHNLPSQLQTLTLEKCRVGRLSEDMANLRHLATLHIRGDFGDAVQGWQHLPRQLRSLHITACAAQFSPGQLALFKQLEDLNLEFNHIFDLDSYWHLSRQLRSLDLSNCSMDTFPKELERLTCLTRLDYRGNDFDSDDIRAPHLPSSLQSLNLGNCRMNRMPNLEHLEHLTSLDLQHNNVNHLARLPPRLRHLNVCSCGLSAVPHALEALQHLEELNLCENDLRGGWQHLPRQLKHLSLGNLGYRLDRPEVTELPPELAGVRLERLDARAITSGWQHLPRSLQRLELDCRDGLDWRQFPDLPRLRHLCLSDHHGDLPPQLAGFEDLQTLVLSDMTIRGWQHLPRRLRELRIQYPCQLDHLPPELAGLSQLHTLQLLCCRDVRDGLQHLPSSLRVLSMHRDVWRRAPPSVQHRPGLLVVPTY